MKKYILIAFLLFSFSGFSQDLNKYKYLIVPAQFSFQSEINQYRLNSSLKFVVEKQGFTILFDNDQLPLEILKDRCQAMYLDVIKEKAFLTTKLTVVIKDCQNTVLFTSESGRSKIKDYDKAYNEAMFMALESLKKIRYKYDGSNEVKAESTAPQNTPFTTQNTNSVAVTISKDMLFAQPTTNGYQLVDTTPKIIITLYKTSQQDYYLATRQDVVNGVVYLKNSEWFFDFYKDGKLVSEKLNIKF